MTTEYVDSSTIRTLFASAMSAMYQQEVPMYGTLLDLVGRVNRQLLEQDERLKQELQASDNLERLNLERHGAIRLGSAAELAMMRRLFAVMGMYPVAYYDLTEAGMPVHSTAFRPLDPDPLKRNPFRIFTSLLRLDLVNDSSLRDKAQSLLARRRIFSKELSLA